MALLSVIPRVSLHELSAPLRAAYPASSTITAPPSILIVELMTLLAVRLVSVPSASVFLQRDRFQVCGIAAPPILA